MAVNRKLPTARLNLDPGLKRKTKFGEQSHLKHFWNDYQGDMKCLILNWRILTAVNFKK